MENKALLLTALLLYVSNPGMRYYIVDSLVVPQSFNILKDFVIVLVDLDILLHGRRYENLSGLVYP